MLHISALHSAQLFCYSGCRQNWRIFILQDKLCTDNTFKLPQMSQIARQMYQCHSVYQFVMANDAINIFIIFFHAINDTVPILSWSFLNETFAHRVRYISTQPGWVKYQCCLISLETLGSWHECKKLIHWIWRMLSCIICYNLAASGLKKVVELKLQGHAARACFSISFFYYQQTRFCSPILSNT